MQPPSSAVGSRSLTLVTGVTGFAGGHLAEALLARGHRVVGVSRRGTWPAAWAHLAAQVEIRACDLREPTALEALLREVAPQRIVHVAGSAQVGRSFREPDAAWEGNLTATRRLYEAIDRWGGQPRILYVGSGLIYGDGDEPGRPLDESLPLRPTSPYAASKAAADLVSYQYARNPGLEIVRARPFNHIGPRQSPDFAVAHFAQQLVAIERGQSAPLLETGNLSTYRDLTDVRDTVTAYVLLLEHGRPGEAYNIGCGQSVSMQEVLDRLVALTGRQVKVRQRDELLRPGEQAIIRVDAGKLHRATGWSPRFNLDQTLTDTLAYWRTMP